MNIGLPYINPKPPFKGALSLPELGRAWKYEGRDSLFEGSKPKKLSCGHIFHIAGAAQVKPGQAIKAGSVCVCAYMYIYMCDI